MTDDDQNAAGRPADSSDKKTRFSVSINPALTDFWTTRLYKGRITLLIGALMTSEEAFHKKKKKKN